MKSKIRFFCDRNCIKKYLTKNRLIYPNELITKISEKEGKISEKEEEKSLEK